MKGNSPLASMIFERMDLLDLAVMHADILIRQRDSQVHDPGCATVIVNPPNRWNNSAKACNCWLSLCPVNGHPQSYNESALWPKVHRYCPRCTIPQPICVEADCMICGTPCPPEDRKGKRR